MTARGAQRLANRRRTLSIDRSARRACAWMLALLAALPFTAPFSTCTVGMLLGPSPHVAVGASAHDAPVMAAPDNGRGDTSPGPLLDEESFKDVILADITVPAFGAAERASAPGRAVVTSTPRRPRIALRL